MKTIFSGQVVSISYCGDDVIATVEAKSGKTIKLLLPGVILGEEVKIILSYEGDRTVRCKDCGLPYKEHGLDITLPHDQWLALYPEGGILCGTCIARRAERLPGAIAIRAYIEGGQIDEIKFTGHVAAFSPSRGVEHAEIARAKTGGAITILALRNIPFEHWLYQGEVEVIIRPKGG